MSDTQKFTPPAGVIQLKPYLSFHYRGKVVDLRTATPELIKRIAADPQNSVLGLATEKTTTAATSAKEDGKKEAK